MSQQESTIRLLFFSLLRDATGAAELTWPLPAPVTVGTLLSSLYAAHPALEKWDAQLLVAVDLEFASRTDVVRPGQEVALMPPVQGG